MLKRISAHFLHIFLALAKILRRPLKTDCWIVPQLICDEYLNFQVLQYCTIIQENALLF